jgi:hypothetical protein
MTELFKVINVRNVGHKISEKWYTLVILSLQSYKETCYASCWKLDSSPYARYSPAINALEYHSNVHPTIRKMNVNV